MDGVKPPKGLAEGDLIEVLWFDACGDGGWGELDDEDLVPHDIASVGYLANWNKQALTLVQSLDTTANLVDNWITVPWPNISSVEAL
jgi:hypothetical protein